MQLMESVRSECFCLHTSESVGQKEVKPLSQEWVCLSAFQLDPTGRSKQVYGQLCVNEQVSVYTWLALNLARSGKTNLSKLLTGRIMPASVFISICTAQKWVLQWLHLLSTDVIRRGSVGGSTWQPGNKCFQKEELAMAASSFLWE